MHARDRQDQLLGVLARGGLLTVPVLARRFEVSERTIQRDFAALRVRGFEIVVEPGRGGGIRIDTARMRRSVELELDEIVGLYLALSLAQRIGTLPFGARASIGLDRLLAAIPAARLRELRRFLRRVLVGRPATASMLASYDRSRREAFEQIEQAFTNTRVLSFRYMDRAQTVSRRRAEPHALFANPPLWYVLAHDRDRDAPRMFRVDRMSELKVLWSERFVPEPLSVITQLVVTEAR